MSRTWLTPAAAHNPRRTREHPELLLRLRRIHVARTSFISVRGLVPQPSHRGLDEYG